MFSATMTGLLLYQLQLMYPLFLCPYPETEKMDPVKVVS